MKALARFLALTIAVALLAAFPGTALAALRLGVQEIDTSAYPNVSARVTLPPEMIGEGRGEPSFAVRENGAEVRVKDANPVDTSEEPQEVLLLIDVSGSMRGQPLTDAVVAASRFLDVVDPSVAVGLIAIETTPRLLSAPSDDRAALKAALQGLQAGGGTAVYDAMAIGAALPSATLNVQRTFVLLSDGADKGSAITLDATIDRLKSARIPVLAVALESDEYNPVALEMLGRETGGRVVSVKESSGLITQFEAFAKEIGARYEVVYRSSRPPTKDIDIDVTATVGESTAIAQTAYPNPALALVGTTAPAVTTVIRTNPLVATGAVLAAFGCVVLATVGLVMLLWKDRTGIEQLRFYDQLRAAPEGAQDDPSSMTGRLLQAIGYVASRRGFVEEIGVRIERAGLLLRPLEFIAGHLLGVIVVGVLIQFAFNNVAASLLAVLFATVAPLLYLSLKGATRLRAFEQQLPDVFSLIAGSLRAGWGMQQAIDHVVQEAQPPASVEFKRVQTAARLGVPLERALQQMADRLGSDDFKWAVSAIAIQREVGGNLAEMLDIISATVRERAALKRHVGALTAEGRFSAIILIGLPFFEAFMLLIINPTYMAHLYSEPLGLGMIAFALLLMLIGGLWLNAVTKVEV